MSSKILDIESHIAEIIASEKEVLGQPAWQKVSSKQDSWQLKASVRAKIETDFKLSIVLDTNVKCPFQRGSIILTCSSAPIERMEHCNRRQHVNKLDKAVPKHLRGLDIPPDICRYYSWDNNRRYKWPNASRPLNLPVSEPISELNTKLFFDSVKYFLKRTNLKLEVPDLHYDARLGLQ